jgi:hypothetical protein
VIREFAIAKLQRSVSLAVLVQRLHHQIKSKTVDAHHDVSSNWFYPKWFHLHGIPIRKMEFISELFLAEL